MEIQKPDFITVVNVELFNRGSEIAHQMLTINGINQNDMPLDKSTLVEFKNMVESHINSIKKYYQDTLVHIQRCTNDPVYRAAFEHRTPNKPASNDPDCYTDFNDDLPF